MDSLFHQYKKTVERLIAEVIGPQQEKRLISIDELPHHVATLQIASDDLSLDQKMQLEKALLHYFKTESRSVKIYFKRLRLQNAPAPTPVEAASGPYGIKIKHQRIPNVKKVYAVASGKGGVGKSTTSVNLSVAMAKLGAKAGYLDADLYGPSAPLAFGTGQGNVLPSTSSSGKIKPLHRHAVDVVSFGYFAAAREPIIWRGPLLSKAFEQLLFETEWNDLDALIIDLPPGTGDIHLTLLERIPLDGALIVTTPQEMAAIDAERAISMFDKLEVMVLGLIENMSSFHCPECGADTSVFSHRGTNRIVEEKRLPVLARIPLDRALAESADLGIPFALGNHPISKEYQRIARLLLDS